MKLLFLLPMLLFFKLKQALALALIPLPSPSSHSSTLSVFRVGCPSNPSHHMNPSCHHSSRVMLIKGRRSEAAPASVSAQCFSCSKAKAHLHSNQSPGHNHDQASHLFSTNPSNGAMQHVMIADVLNLPQTWWFQKTKSIMIHFVILFSRQGKLRLQKW